MAFANYPAIKIEEFLMKKQNDGQIVKYSAFGAVGDGVTDDFEAIVAAHEYANERGLKVEADEGATYYVGSHRKSAVILTDVDWCDAHFIIDDSVVKREDSKYSIFSICSEHEPFKATLPDGYSLKRGDKNIGLQFDTKVLIFVENADKRVYIRCGATLANSGAAQREVLLVHPDGQIDDSTPVIFDYDKVTDMTVYRVDDAPLLIQGGTFTTYSNCGGDAKKWCGYWRGIEVRRSNTTVYNVKHLIEREHDDLDASCPYVGFFLARLANNVVFDSCVMFSHKTYRHGTYDTQANTANNVTWKNCTQADRIDRFGKGYWGVMASNYVKNLTFDGCVLSRFDAHCGVHNVTIKDSEIGEIINLVGTGDCYIENTLLSSGHWHFFVRLREDYGAIWDGTLTVKNCKLRVPRSAGSAYLLRCYWNEHYFGYKCALPNIYVDGFSVEYLDGGAYDGKLFIFKAITDTDEDLRKNETNPLGVPSVISLKGIAQPYEMMENPGNNVILSDTKIIRN